MSRYLLNTVFLALCVALSLSFLAVYKGFATLAWIDLLAQNTYLAALIGGAILVLAVLCTWVQDRSESG